MKLKKNILVVGPYPIVKPQHGGQKRTAALVDFYERLFSDVKYTAVFHRGQYPEWGKHDFPLGDINIINKVDLAPYASELLSGEAIDKDIHVRSPMAKLLMEYMPEIIHIEQPFAYLGLRKLLSELGLKPKIIFGSQNIEYVLKERIFEELKVAKDEAQALVAQTKRLEERLSREADIVIAVNEEDAKSHREMGAKECHVVPNGINKDTPQDKEVAYWRHYMKQRGIHRVIIFVGSGHPPNWESFLKLVGDNTDFLADDSKIFVVGGVASYFDNTFSDKGKHASFWSHLETLGYVSEERLTALIEISDVILLPILTLRGSNLKTAEAIASQKKIVSTSHAFKGFERYSNLPNIFIADEPTEFRACIEEALKKPYQKPSVEETFTSEGVLWKNCLSPLKPIVWKLALKLSVERLMGLSLLDHLRRKFIGSLMRIQRLTSRKRR